MTTLNRKTGGWVSATGRVSAVQLSGQVPKGKAFILRVIEGVALLLQKLGGTAGSGFPQVYGICEPFFFFFKFPLILSIKQVYKDYSITYT